MSDWTTPADARAQVQRLWGNGTLLTANLRDKPLFPLSLRLNRPNGRALVNEFDDVRRWIRELEAQSRAATGVGYEIEWTEIEHRQLGRNRVPTGLVVTSREDGLRWIGKQRQAERFDAAARTTLDTFPILRTWVIKKPLVMLEHADCWERILAVLAWFRDHPRASVYLRQIDVRGVDTKFIEARRSLFVELLDLVLPSEVVDRESKRSFETRYGLMPRPSLVRFRVLDPSKLIAGMSDVSTPLADFAKLTLDIRYVFVTENELNGLVFPSTKEAIVIFGLGYGLDVLREVSWLDDKEIHYWGDIDTHGFAILDRFRARFPGVRSFLMNRATLEHHRDQWVEERTPHLAPLSRLSPDERSLYEDLAANRIGIGVRLEQERIGFTWFERALHELVGRSYCFGGS